MWADARSAVPITCHELGNDGASCNVGANAGMGIVPVASIDSAMVLSRWSSSRLLKRSKAASLDAGPLTAS